MHIPILIVLLGYILIPILNASLPVRKPLSETVRYLQGEETKIKGEYISLEQTELLLKTVWDNAGCSSEVIDPDLCRGCMRANTLFDIVQANKSAGLQEQDFERASVVLLFYLENGICKLPAVQGTNYTYVDYLYDVITTQVPSMTLIGQPVGMQTFDPLPLDMNFSEEQLHHILNLIKDNYTPKTVNKCFTSKDVFDDIGLKHDELANENDVEMISSVVIANLIRGDCIGKSETLNPSFFVESIFENYGTFGTILDHDFDLLLEDMGIGTTHTSHFHHDSRSWRDPDIRAKDPDVSKRKRRENGEINNQNSRQQRRAMAATQNPDVHMENDHQHEHGHDHGHQQSSHQCYSYRELLQIYEIKEDIGGVSTFNTICPALVEQVISRACVTAQVERIADQSGTVYGWATLAVFLITLCSMIGIIIVPLASVKVYTGIMHLFVALAVSTLSGDALLHLIPEALGLHSHGNHGHRSEEPATPEQVLGKVMVVVAAIYAFFLFERIMMVCLGRNPHRTKPDKMGELADDGNPTEYTPAMFQAGNQIEMDDIIDDIPQFSDIDNIDKYSAAPITEDHPPPPTPEGAVRDSVTFENIPDSAQYQSHELTDTLFVERKKKELSTRTSFSFTKGMQSVSVMVLIADAVHNTTDGIAIGVAFTLDVYVGISTCVAVFCHELPHEIGDFAVLLKNGLNFRTAFFWSLLSNLCGFFGVYIGIALGTNEALHQWIFAGTAGMFLYIALVDLMPEITHDTHPQLSSSVFLMHNIGLVMGWTLMILLSYFEGSMMGDNHDTNSDQGHPTRHSV